MKSDFGDLQMAILRVLWRRGEADLGTIRRDLHPDRDPAPSTAATVLSRLDEQGVVSRRKDGNRYLYRAELEQSDVRASVVDDLLERFFGGEADELVSHLLAERDLEDVDLEELRRRIESEES